MANVLHRPPHGHAAAETVPQAPEKVPESHEVREHRMRVADTPEQERTHIRWRRWLALVLLALAGLITAIVLTSDRAGEDEIIDWPTPTAGPGSNSLIATATETIDWPTQTAGPGSNSLSSE